MARWCILLVLALAVVASARNIPSDVGLENQKNFLGVGYSGVGSNGLPFGGVGSGYDGNIGGPLLGGFGGFGGPGGPTGGLGGFGTGPGIGADETHLPLP